MCISTMKTLHLLFMFLLSWVVLLCYAAVGVETHSGVYSSIKCINNEREALLLFKHGIKSDDCGLLTSWGATEDCCQWRGIRCSNRTGHVIRLDLHSDELDKYCLEGKVNPSLFELKDLKYLDLSNNDFQQTIPKSIDSLTYLEHLNFSHSGFFGEIPPQLGNLSKLASLDLSYSDALSTKSLQWLSRLKLLREINLTHTDLSRVTDLFQSINILPSLRVLYLDDCHFPASSLSFINSSAALHVVSLSNNNINDTSIFQWLFNLSRKGNQFVHLDLSYNDLSGPLPNAFGNMHSLSYLSLSYNKLEGHIPDNFSNLRSLRTLSLSQNNFHGSISKILGKLCNLQELYLDNNSFDEDLSNFIGTLSTGCANKPLLEYLDLGTNKLWGSVPDMISSFASLRELDLYGNQLNETISQGIGKLSMLEKLDVANCSLKATLNHNHFANLSRLRELYLSDNSALEISTNADWIPPFQLNIISLRSCKLGPYFPKWLVNQTNFSYLDISNTQISGTIPADFWTKSLSSNLQYLSMSHNKLRGVLPNLGIPFDIFCEIDLSSNYFEGSIPSFLAAIAFSLYLNDNLFSNATHLLCPENKILLDDLDLSNNLLSGELPNCWIKLDKLFSLHLGNNKFSGNIPTSIGTLQSLNYLHLDNNSFSGELPASLDNCSDLGVLDLSYNSLTGHIPSSIGNAFTRLGILNLRGNKFIGRLPLSICQMSNLQILDIAHNQISGTIPSCIHNLTAMMDGDGYPFGRSGTVIGEEPILENAETAVIEWKRKERKLENTLELVYSIDLSSNELEGEIPDGISNLKKLISLDLSRNKLTGSIISNIGKLTSLELVDLSNNQLSGVIPISLAELSYLGTLDLSNNNLSGKIPLGTQLQGYDPSSYEGNPLLCGAPLRECPGDEPPAKTITWQDEHGNDDIYPGLYICVLLGFIIGFWGVCGTLVLKTSWRHAFFRFFDDLKDKLYVFIVLNVARCLNKT